MVPFDVQQVIQFWWNSASILQVANVLEKELRKNGWEVLRPDRDAPATVKPLSAYCVCHKDLSSYLNFNSDVVQYAEVDEANWQRRLDVIQSRLPAYIELLNEQVVSKLTGPQVSAYNPVIPYLILFNFQRN